MSGRSPSGVASLRARFEQNADPESLTPSRGRSPAGSINSDTSRPLSKVRTSFISVGEPSGQMGDLLVGKEPGKPISGDGAEDSAAKEHSKPNGTGPTSAPKQVAEHPVKAQEDQITSKPNTAIPEKPSEITTASSSTAADLEKPTAGEETKSPFAPPADRESQATAPGVEEAAKDKSDLGSILKGSAFENEEAKKEAAPQKPVASSTTKVTAPAGGASKAHTASTNAGTVKAPTSMDKAANGKPKEVQATQAKPQAKPASEKAATIKPQGAPESATPADTKPLSKGLEKKETSTKQTPAAASTSDNKDKASKTNPASSAPNKTTTAAVAAPQKQPVSKKSQPSKEPTEEAAKGPRPSTNTLARKSTHPTEASGSSNPKMARSAAPASSKPSAKKAVHPTSPPISGTGFTKPKPRSPTRPINLPSHLTAPTTASAAKHGDDSHVEPHRDEPAGNDQHTGARAPTQHPVPQRKPPRASMPAVASSSKIAEKEKPKSRMSVAGGSAPGGSSFLERMMRPTQSSAQKTHDRAAEPPGKTSPPPPRKVSSGATRNVSGAGAGAGPKTATGASTHKPDQHAHNDGGHGDRREKHGGATKSEVEHGEGREEARGSGKGKERVATAAADSETKPTSVVPPKEQGLPSAPNTLEKEVKEEDQTNSTAAGAAGAGAGAGAGSSDSGMKET